MSDRMVIGTYAPSSGHPQNEVQTFGNTPPTFLSKLSLLSTEGSKHAPDDRQPDIRRGDNSQSRIEIASRTLSPRYRGSNQNACCVSTSRRQIANVEMTVNWDCWRIGIE